MTSYALRRHRWLAAALLGLTGAGFTVAQVDAPQEVSLPPLVVTPPKPAAKPATPPKVETPKVETPKVETPKVETPKVETPKIELPKAEIPKIDPPKLETPPPVISVPATTASLIKPVVKPAMAEIVAAGPAPVDATESLTNALKDARTALGSLRDLSGHLIIQERLRGELQPEQTAEIRWKAQPKSIALKYIAPSSLIGREVIHVDGRHANKARVKAAGTYGPLAFANLAVSDAKAMVTAKGSVLEMTPAAVLDRVDRAVKMEQKLRNPVSVMAADYTFAGKTVTRYELLFDHGHALRDAPKLVVCIDPDTKLIVRFEAHDATLRESLSFVNLTFNKGLGDAVFEK